MTDIDQAVLAMLYWLLSVMRGMAEADRASLHGLSPKFIVANAQREFEMFLEWHPRGSEDDAIDDIHGWSVTWQVDKDHDDIVKCFTSNSDIIGIEAVESADRSGQFATFSLA